MYVVCTFTSHSVDKLFVCVCVRIKRNQIKWDQGEINVRSRWDQGEIKVKSKWIEVESVLFSPIISYRSRSYFFMLFGQKIEN